VRPSLPPGRSRAEDTAPGARKRARRVREAARGNPPVETPAGRPGSTSLLLPGRGDGGVAAQRRAHEGRARSKSDVRDAEWIAQLLEHGLLAPSFLPPPEIRRLRMLTRAVGHSQDRERSRRRSSPKPAQTCPDPHRRASGCVNRVGAGDARVGWETESGRQPARQQVVDRDADRGCRIVGRMHGKNYLAAQHALSVRRHPSSSKAAWYKAGTPPTAP
jgi:hypothetical protein